MARIQPFRAWRPAPGAAAAIASPPYDVLSSDEARTMAAGNPDSFLHVGKPEIDLLPSTDVYSDEVYAKGAENFRALVARGRLIRDEAPCLYLYRQRMGDHTQTGVVAGASVVEYESDVIKKHEHTRRKKEDDRTRHVDTLNAHTGPVFLTYRARPEIDDLVRRLTSVAPTYDFVAADGIQHTLWVVGRPVDRDALAAAFQPVPVLYVADGHHRSAAGVRVCRERREANKKHTGEEPYNFFLSVIFPDNQMKVMDYNRVVRDLHGLDQAAFMKRVEERFEVTPVDGGRPQRARCFGMFLGGHWYRLTAKPEHVPDDPVRGLDVAILQENLLAPVLGIGDPRSDERIDFVGGIRGLEELERLVGSGRFAVAFALHPTSIEQLFAVADAGQVMPPKSTWFEPKLRDGLVSFPLED